MVYAAIAAISVIFEINPLELIFSTSLIPCLYPWKTPKYRIPKDTILIPITKKIGPIQPNFAFTKEIARLAKIGRAVPFNKESPKPASGPIRAVFTALIAPGSISGSLACISSIAAAIPTGMALVISLVKKYSI